MSKSSSICERLKMEHAAGGVVRRLRVNVVVPGRKYGSLGLGTSGSSSTLSPELEPEPSREVSAIGSRASDVGARFSASSFEPFLGTSREAITSRPSGFESCLIAEGSLRARDPDENAEAFMLESETLDEKL